jgi:hypothetical protein
LSKKAVHERTRPDVPITLDIFGELLACVYDNADKVARARDKLDSVYQGKESLEKYVERFTTLLADVEVAGELSSGEKVHRFRKGLRDDLKKFSAINPSTGKQYEDIDALIQMLTAYDAALGGGQERRYRSGAPSMASTQVMEGSHFPWTGPDWTSYQMVPYQQAPAPTTYTATYAVPYQQVPFMAGALPMPPPNARRDGLPPEQRVDTRVSIDPDRKCFSCGFKGHERHSCPWKFMGEHPQRDLEEKHIRALRNNIAYCNRKGLPYPIRPQGRHAALMRSLGAQGFNGPYMGEGRNQYFHDQGRGGGGGGRRGGRGGRGRGH